MRILMVTSEAAPFAKTGGLADVAGALPHALARLGHEVDVVMPRYRGIDAGAHLGRLPVTLGPQLLGADFYSAMHAGVRTLFVDHPGYYDRDYLYGVADRDYADNAERFAFLCQAALTWAAADGHYDVAHAHDWQAGLVPVLAAQMFRTGALTARLPTVFTIHNLAYQGIFDASWLPRLGLPWDLMHRLQPVHHHRQPALCRGDPDAGVRFRLRRHPAGTCRRTGRDSQRNRLRSVGSGPRPAPADAV
jgi:starch synthase